MNHLPSLEALIGIDEWVCGSVVNWNPYESIACNIISQLIQIRRRNIRDYISCRS